VGIISLLNSIYSHYSFVSLRSSSVSYRTASAGSGLLFSISFSWQSSNLEPALFKHSSNSLLSAPCLVSAWEEFGVSQRLLPLRIFPLRLVVSQAVSSNKDMQLVILLQPSSTFFWFQRWMLGGERCFGPDLAFHFLQQQSGQYSQRVTSSWERKQLRRRGERTRVRKPRFSSARSRPCWRSTGYFVSTLYCLWQVGICSNHLVVATPWLTFHLGFNFLSHGSQVHSLKNKFGSKITLLWPFLRICIPHTWRNRRAFRRMMLLSLLLSVTAWVSSSDLFRILNPNLSFFLGCPRVCPISQLHRRRNCVN